MTTPVYMSKISISGNTYEIKDADARTSISNLATVATSGSYADLSNKPTIPTITDTYSSSSTDGMSGIAVSSAINSAISSVYKPAGSITFINLPTPSSSNEGNVYNVSDAFTTDTNFVEGAGKSYPAGTNVVIINTSGTTYKYDVLAGFIDLSGYQLANTAVTHTTSTAVGSATQPVYVASNGVATATTYELNKTVPADAVFTDTTYSAFNGADDTSAGTSGLVPAPTATDNTKFLKGNGTWATIPTVIPADNSTITENTSNQLQTVGIINQNTISGSINPLKVWQGTEEQWNTGGGSQLWYNWNISSPTIENVELTVNNFNIKGIAYGNNKFMAVRSTGGTLYSIDGTDWSYKSTGISTALNSIIYVNNKFIAVGASTRILTLGDNDTDWTSETLGYANNFYGIAYGNNKFIVVGESGLIYSSTDGSTWTQETSPIDPLTFINLYGIAYGNNKFIAVGKSGTIISSTDGSTWTIETSNISTDLRSVTYGNGKFIVVGTSGKILSSTDGSTWTQETSGTSSTLVSVTYGNGKFIAVGTQTIRTSIDGSTWTYINAGVSIRNELLAVAYGNNRFITAGSCSSSNTPPVVKILIDSVVYTLDENPTTASTVYSEPNTTSALTITSVGTGTITLSDTNIYNYNANGNQITTISIGQTYPDYLCFINSVGIKIGTTSIVTVDQTYNANSTNAQSGIAVNSIVGNINTVLESIIAQGD